MALAETRTRGGWGSAARRSASSLVPCTRLSSTRRVCSGDQRDAAIDSPARWIDRVHPDQRGRVEFSLRRVPMEIARAGAAAHQTADGVAPGGEERHQTPAQKPGAARDQNRERGLAGEPLVGAEIGRQGGVAVAERPLQPPPDHRRGQLSRGPERQLVFDLVAVAAVTGTLGFEPVGVDPPHEGTLDLFIDELPPRFRGDVPCHPALSDRPQRHAEDDGARAERALPLQHGYRFPRRGEAFKRSGPGMPVIGRVGCNGQLAGEFESVSGHGVLPGDMVRLVSRRNIGSADGLCPATPPPPRGSRCRSPARLPGRAASGSGHPRRRLYLHPRSATRFPVLITPMSRNHLRFAAALLGALPAAPLEAQVADSSPFRPLDLPAPNQLRTGAGRPGAGYWQQRVDYRIRASLDPATHELRGRAAIHYVNRSPEALPYLWLHVEQNICAPGSVTSALDQPPLVFLGTAFDFSCKGFPGGLTLESIGALGRPLRHTVVGTTMRVDLPRAIPAGGVFDFEVSWRFTVPPYGAGRMGRDGSLYQIAQWYPRLAVYDDVRGWNHEPYIGAGEFYLEYGRFDVALTVPADYVVAATGTLDNPLEVLTAAQRARLRQARSADSAIAIISADEAGDAARTRPRQAGTLTWRFHADSVRDFAFAAAPDFRWDASGWRGILIHTFYRPGAQLWPEANRMVREALRYYSEQWYHYPYPQMSSVEGPIEGMEYPMLTFDPAGPTRIDLQWVLAHELGHQWMPMVVGSNERLYPWMDEGFNTFIDLANAATYFEGTGYGDSIESNPLRLYPDHAVPGLEQPLISRPVEVSDLFWTGYQKPALMLQLLRNEVLGRERFDRRLPRVPARLGLPPPHPGGLLPDHAGPVGTGPRLVLARLGAHHRPARPGGGFRRGSGRYADGDPPLQPGRHGHARDTRPPARRGRRLPGHTLPAAAGGHVESRSPVHLSAPRPGGSPAGDRGPRRGTARCAPRQQQLGSLSRRLAGRLLALAALACALWLLQTLPRRPGPAADAGAPMTTGRAQALFWPSIRTSRFGPISGRTTVRHTSGGSSNDFRAPNEPADLRPQRSRARVSAAQRRALLGGGAGPARAGGELGAGGRRGDSGLHSHPGRLPQRHGQPSASRQRPGAGARRGSERLLPSGERRRFASPPPPRLRRPLPLGGIVAGEEGWNEDRNWWYFERPRNPGPVLQRELEGT